MAIVADQDTDLDAEGSVEDREPQIAGGEIVPLVAGGWIIGVHRTAKLRNATLPVLAHDLAVRPDENGCVVPGTIVVFVQRIDDEGARLQSHLSHAVYRWARHWLGQMEVVRVDLIAEVD